MAAAGAETSTANYSLSPPDIQALAKKHRFIAESAFTGGIMYYNGFYDWYQGAPKFDPAKPKETGKALIAAMKKVQAKPGPISRPTYVPFFAEPQIGNITTGIWPSHYGEEYKLTEAEQKTFADMKAKYLLGAAAIRKEWPNYKLLLPYGDPMNTAVFLKLAPEARGLDRRLRPRHAGLRAAARAAGQPGRAQSPLPHHEGHQAVQAQPVPGADRRVLRLLEGHRHRPEGPGRYRHARFSCAHGLRRDPLRSPPTRPSTAPITGAKTITAAAGIPACPWRCPSSPTCITPP